MIVGGWRRGRTESENRLEADDVMYGNDPNESMRRRRRKWNATRRYFSKLPKSRSMLKITMLQTWWTLNRKRNSRKRYPSIHQRRQKKRCIGNWNVRVWGAREKNRELLGEIRSRPRQFPCRRRLDHDRRQRLKFGYYTGNDGIASLKHELLKNSGTTERKRPKLNKFRVDAKALKHVRRMPPI
jgi:hypothetical protein